jgi:hypothetical protein
MGVNLRWEDERGKELAVVLDPRNEFAHALNEANLNQTVCLRFIDPWGDTTFNSLQMPVLVEELEELLRRRPSKILQRMVELAKRGQDEVHTYMKFCGD